MPKKKDKDENEGMGMFGTSIDRRPATKEETEKLIKERIPIKGLQVGDVLVAKKSVSQWYRVPNPGDEVVVARVFDKIEREDGNDDKDFAAFMWLDTRFQICALGSWHFTRKKNSAPGLKKEKK